MSEDIVKQETSQSRIRLLREEILKEADEQAKQIIAEANLEAEKILNQAKTDSEKIKTELVEREKGPADIEAKRLIATSSLELKLKMAKKKEEIINTAFTKAIDTLRRFQASNEYSEVLEQLIVEGAIALNGGNLEVFVRSEDISKLQKEKLTQILKKEGISATIILKEIDREIIGGAYISKEGKIWVDNTLEARFERRKEDIRVAAAEVLFGRK